MASTMEPSGQRPDWPASRAERELPPDLTGETALLHNERFELREEREKAERKLREYDSGRWLAPLGSVSFFGMAWAGAAAGDPGGTFLFAAIMSAAFAVGGVRSWRRYPVQVDRVEELRAMEAEVERMLAAAEGRRSRHEPAAPQDISPPRPAAPGDSGAR